MAMTLPQALQKIEDDDALDLLHSYYGGAGYTLTAGGAAFDAWDSRASKLIARKRPRLRPIWDSVVVEVTGTRDHQWEPMRQALRADGRALHHRLLRLRDKAGLDTTVSALRVFDVIAWREGKRRDLRASEDIDGADR